MSHADLAGNRRPDAPFHETLARDPVFFIRCRRRPALSCAPLDPRRDHLYPARSHLRLKQQLELILRKAAPQFRGERSTCLRVGAEHGLKMTAHPAPIGLGLIKGKIGVRDQSLRRRLT
ncbi:MAG TPA: hypothetical protein VH678_31050 [Xanthobacteraceae bacterium]